MIFIWIQYPKKWEWKNVKILLNHGLSMVDSVIEIEWSLFASKKPLGTRFRKKGIWDNEISCSRISYRDSWMSSSTTTLWFHEKFSLTKADKKLFTQSITCYVIWSRLLGMIWFWSRLLLGVVDSSNRYRSFIGHIHTLLPLLVMNSTYSYLHHINILHVIVLLLIRHYSGSTFVELVTQTSVSLVSRGEWRKWTKQIVLVNCCPVVGTFNLYAVLSVLQYTG
jgi:hypothetical protein